jgi:hypothetical protein
MVALVLPPPWPPKGDVGDTVPLGFVVGLAVEVGWQSGPMIMQPVEGVLDGVELGLPP